MSASGLAAHLSPAELGQRYRAARSPVERSHLQIVWLLSRGRGEREVAQVTGYGRRWVGEVARRYDEGGPDGLGDRRRGNAGARPLLGAEDEAALRGARAAGGGGGRGRGRRGGSRWRSRPPTGACGRGRRWRRGWRPGSAARSGRNAAGTTSRGSATAPHGPRRGPPRRRAPRSRRRKKSWPPRWTSTARRSPGGRSRSGRSTSTGSG